MLLKRLNLRNFRNYKSLEMVPNSSVNVLYGANAQGKTNVLEAIHLLSRRRSHRADRDRDMVRWGEDAFSVEGVFGHQGTDFEVSVLYDEQRGKTVRINGLSRRAAERLFPDIHTVLFVPDDLQMIKGPASLRRNFIDQEISGVNSSYAFELTQYGKALSQRNSLLREGASSANPVLVAYTERLVEHGINIYKRRLRALSRLVPMARQIYLRLSQGELLEVMYRPSVDLPRIHTEEPNSDDKKSENLIREAFYRRLEERQDLERARSVTLVGPHRDDIAFMVSGRDARHFGSQGQQRSVVVSMKAAELSFIYNETGHHPILLLDDILSELDEKRREAILSSVSKGVQIFLTCTDHSVFDPELLCEVDYFRVREGTMERVSDGREDR